MKRPLDSWADRDVVVESKPWLMYISLTNICNSRCVVCAHTHAMRKEQGCMDFDLFKKIIKQMPTEVKKVYLFKQGEPFVHPKLEECIAYLRKVRPSINISLHTNGIVAKKERVRKILSLVDSIGISVSAITSDIYLKAHDVDRFDSVMENIKDISDLMRENKGKKIPHVFIDYIQQDANKSEKKEDVIAYYRDNFPGLSSVDFHWVYNFQGETEEGDIDVYNQIPHGKFPQCVFPWSAMTVCYDGKVSYCFVEPRENKFLGDFNTQSFEEIWNGEEYLAFRKDVLAKDFDRLLHKGIYCKKCSWLWSMKSQSPKNMAGGYALEFKDKKNYDFGDLLDMSFGKKYECALDAFNSGEIDKAIGILSLIQVVDTDMKVAKDISMLMTKCTKVLDNYKYLNLWQEQMAKEGIDVDERKCTYYKIGEK